VKDLISCYILVLTNLQILNSSSPSTVVAIVWWCRGLGVEKGWGWRGIESSTIGRMELYFGRERTESRLWVRAGGRGGGLGNVGLSLRRCRGGGRWRRGRLRGRVAIEY